MKKTILTLTALVSLTIASLAQTAENSFNLRSGYPLQLPDPGNDPLTLNSGYLVVYPEGIFFTKART
jgi:hypothetical protein